VSPAAAALLWVDNDVVFAIGSASGWSAASGFHWASWCLRWYPESSLWDQEVILLPQQKMNARRLSRTLKTKKSDSCCAPRNGAAMASSVVMTTPRGSVCKRSQTAVRARIPAHGVHSLRQERSRALIALLEKQTMIWTLLPRVRPVHMGRIVEHTRTAASNVKKGRQTWIWTRTPLAKPALLAHKVVTTTQLCLYHLGLYLTSSASIARQARSI
jgi:hypothetical protein